MGAQELIIILVIVLVLFGARKLPELARSMGTSIKEFRRGQDEADADTGNLPQSSASEPVPGPASSPEPLPPTPTAEQRDGAVRDRT